MIEDPFIRERVGADALEEGFFLLPKRRAGRIDVPIRIWFGPPEDPDYFTRPCADSPSGVEHVPVAERIVLDRAPRWMIEINGVLAGDEFNPVMIAGRPLDDIEEIWPISKGFPITREEYDFRVARAVWAEQFDADDPFGGTGGKVDPMTASLPFL